MRNVGVHVRAQVSLGSRWWGLLLATAATACANAPGAAGTSAALLSDQFPLAGGSIPQFVQPLSTLAIAPQNGTMQTVIGSQPITMRMCEFDARVLPPGTPLAAGASGTTRVWGYIANEPCPAAGTVRDSYIGPVIVNTRGVPTPVTWINELGNAQDTKVLAYKYSSDRTLHWADPMWAEDGLAQPNDCAMSGMMGGPAVGSTCAQNYALAGKAHPIPTVPHLHGGEVPPEIDGGPDAWFTSDGTKRGTTFYTSAAATGPANSVTYVYPNSQEAAPAWFHDHTLGTTRLNVYAGMAGAYFIQDPNQQLPTNLYPLTEVVPVVIQDRMFDTNGQLYFPSGAAAGAPNPDHPYWIPEFVGDTIVVNGKAWPYFNVEAKRYRMLFLNGSNARTYELQLVDPVAKTAGPAMWLIGTDGGYLDKPVKIDPAARQVLAMMPGERYEVIVDFTGFANRNLLLKNNAKTPYPRGAAPQGTTIGQIMQFRVGAAPVVADGSFDPSQPGATIRSANQSIVRLVNPTTGTLDAKTVVAKTRTLTLNEVMGMPVTATDPITGMQWNYPGGPLEVLVNNTKWSGESARPYNDYRSITVTANGRTETTKFSETPLEGTTEIWELVNLTADAHPIHLHLVQFQLLNRQGLDVKKYGAAYGARFPGGAFVPGFGPPLHYDAASNPLSGGRDGGNIDPTKYLQGPVLPPGANEAGWKDTIIVLPGQVTRLVVRWAPTDGGNGTPNLSYPFDPSGVDSANGLQYSYVWHCHIIDHEDNEMMRPDIVDANPNAAPRTFVRGVHY